MKKNEHAEGVTTRTPSPREALAWLKESGQTPEIRTDWRKASTPDTAAYRRFLEILFAPREEDAPA